MSVTISQPFTITITVAPTLAGIALSNTTLVVPGGSADAGDIIGEVSVTTNPPGGAFAGPITLGGADAAKFALTNGGMLPCSLTVGAANVGAGVYSITLNG